MGAIQQPYNHFFSAGQEPPLIDAAHKGWVQNVMPSYHYEKCIDKYPKHTRMIIDSGAYTMIAAKHVDDFDQYHLSYKNYMIQSSRHKKAIWVELDIDEATHITTAQVNESRKDLEGTGNYIMPVWHKNRGTKEWERLTKEYPYIGVSAISGLTADQLQWLVNVAYKNKCCVHGFGCGRKNLWEKVPFYTVDSASWVKAVVYGGFYDENGRTHHRRGFEKADHRTILKGDAVGVLNRTATKFDQAQHNIKQYLKFEKNIRELWLRRNLDFHWAGKTLAPIYW